MQLRRILSVLVALGLMAGLACAEVVAIDAPPSTREDGIPELFPYPEGDKEADMIYADATANTTLLNYLDIDPTGIPGWLHLTIPEEATLTNGRLLFTVPSSSPSLLTAPTFAAGDTIEFYIGEALYDNWFHVTGWSEARLWLEGSAEGVVDVYWYTEKYTDSE